MISRRSAVGAGLGVVTAGALVHVAGLDDNLLRALGARPHPEPDPADARLVRRAVADQQVLLVRLEVLLEAQPRIATALPTVLTAARTQLRQLGGTRTQRTVQVGGEGGSVSSAFSAISKKRAADALAASDTDLARVLASVSAGHAQIARALKGNGA